MAPHASTVDLLRVLLVEDNAGDARLIREELADVARTSYALGHVSGLGDGLRLLLETPGSYDAVLLDLSLPDGQGLGNIVRLRAVAPQVPVVVLTGLDDEDTALQALQFGAQDYLVKGRVSGNEIDRALRYAIERRRCEVMVRQQEEDARDAELRERFIGILGHDLRNPLNTIAVSAAVLDFTNFDERQRQALQRVSSATRRMARMIDDLLDFTRARLGGGFPIDLDTCDLASLCRQVADDVMAARSHATVEVVSTGCSIGQWDIERLTQVVTNLVSNALDHGEPGRPVLVHVEGDGDPVRLHVENAGPPIPKEVLPHIFDAFRRAGVESRERSDGLGLGLFIVRQIVQAHDGTIAVTSTGGVTRFTVDLPRQPAHRA